MPFYEYECSNCKFYSEVMQKITDAPMTKCPSCGKKAMTKLISAPNFRLKGGGWYETDFKGDKENKRNLAGAEKEESSKSEAATERSAREPPAGAASESSKTEASKPEASAKADSATADKATKPASTSAGSSSGAEAKSSSTRRGSTAVARSAQPVARAAPP